ncbi:amino acid racemase [Candidatus Gottesmanbacteria bacterium]|nr:amino acid racemase [Candidatus Gottesmanbacteria bacterium]
MKQNSKTIGVIGGMGPEASERFYGMLIKLSQKYYKIEKNEDFPKIYIASVPVPDFISSQKNQKRALNMLVQTVKEMNKLDIDYFCMACNTGHLLLSDLEKQTNKEFVSLLSLLPISIKNKGISRVGLLATPTTIRTKMYQKPLADNNIELIIPDEGEINMLGTIVMDTIAGKNKKRNSMLIEKIAINLVKKGAQGIVEGCTEIPLISPKRYLVPKFDTLEVLARAVLNRYYLLK